MSALAAIAGPESGVQSLLLYGAEGCELHPQAHQIVESWVGAGEIQRHVDVLWVQPRGAGRQITIAQITESKTKSDEEQVPVLTFVRTRPLKAKRKVVVIEDAERMNTAAANALLKNLEEPAAHVRFLLLTHQISQILPTILSRCVCLHCPLPDPADLGHLTPTEQAFGENAPMILAQIRRADATYSALLETYTKLADGNPHRALALSQEARVHAEELGKKLEIPARAANLEVLRCLGWWLRSHAPTAHAARLATAEFHRRIAGNGHAGLQFDALFVAILSDPVLRRR